MSNELTSLAAEPVENGLVAGLLNEILEDYAPKSAEFDVQLPHGQKIPFRRLCDSLEMKNLQRDAVKWAQSWLPDRNGKTPVLPPDWAEIFVPDAETLAKVYCVTRLAVHPDFKSEKGIMTLAKKAGPIFNAIVQQIDLASANLLDETDAEELEAEKKG